jgi:hypothetical protein
MAGRSLAALLLAPFRWIGLGVRALFAALDRALVFCATPFGVHLKDPLRRYALFLGVYAAVYGLGVLPVSVVPVVALGFGYLGVLAVGRAWVLNEKQRSAIAKKLRDGRPDDMPDLRGVALLSALQLIVLFPLLFQHVHSEFGLFEVRGDDSFWNWLLFTFDSYSRGLLGLLELYGVKLEHGIEPSTAWGRHLVTLKRLTIDWILIQGVVRLFAIRETVRDAVAAVKSDRELAERLGRRAVGPLIRALQDPNVEVRGRAAETLGTLGDARAVSPLLEALRGPSELVRERAARALGQLGDARAVEPLTAALKDPDRYVKAAAADALKRLDPRAAAKAGVR